MTKSINTVLVRGADPRVLFVKSMPAGAVDTGKVYVLTEAQAARFDKDPSVLSALMKQCKERGLDNMEGNVEIRHPKGMVLGLWNGFKATLDPGYDPDLCGVTKQDP